jgi:hypothetical protein
MAASFFCRPAFAIRPNLVNLTTDRVIRARFWRYRHHVITLFQSVITLFHPVIT